MRIVYERQELALELRQVGGPPTCITGLAAPQLQRLPCQVRVWHCLRVSHAQHSACPVPCCRKTGTRLPKLNSSSHGLR